MQDPDFQPPVNPMPPAVVILFLAIAGVEAALSLAEAGLIGGPGAIGWRLGLIRDFGFSGVTFDWMMSQGIWPLQDVLRVVTFPFISWSFVDGLFAMVLLLALGKMVAESMGQLVFVLLFFLSGIGGVVIYALLADDPFRLVGAYPNVYGLIGAYTYVIWRVLGAQGAPQHRAFSLIAILMGIQLLWGVFFDVGTTWIAELAGFACGFGLCFVLAPGEWARLRRRLRQR